MGKKLTRRQQFAIARIRTKLLTSTYRVEAGNLSTVERGMLREQAASRGLTVEQYLANGLCGGPHK